MIPLLLSLLLGAPGTQSIEKLPMPFQSTVPTTIRLVGSRNAVADSTDGTFRVIVRDIAGNPLASSQVSVVFDQAPDLAFCTSQGGNVNCPYRVVSRLTDMTGVAEFALTGCARPGTTPSGAGAVKIYADGVLFTNQLVVSSYDLDGTGGVGGNDLSLWLGDFASNAYAQRGDYDGNGQLGGNDLSLLLDVIGSGRATESCAAVCP